jgi:hypothetical protein
MDGIGQATAGFEQWVGINTTGSDDPSGAHAVVEA